MRTGHADIEATLGIQRHQRILIEERRIVVRGLHITTSDRHDRPRTRAGERLTLYMGKSLLDGQIAFPGLPGNEAGKKSPVVAGSVFHFWKSAGVSTIRHSIPGIWPGKGLKWPPASAKAGYGIEDVSPAPFGSAIRQIMDRLRYKNLPKFNSAIASLASTNG
jgi:hypothetical protein